jgi:hypothetical protein
MDCQSKVYTVLLVNISTVYSDSVSTSNRKLSGFFMVYNKEFIIKMEGNTAEFSDISGSEIH